MNDNKVVSIDANGTLWIEVDDISKVNRVIVTESKSKFCCVMYPSEDD